MYRRDLFEEESDRLTISRRAQEIPVDRIENPFTIRIDEDRSNLNDGVFIHLKTTRSCQLRVFWLVNIQRFYAELDATDFRNSLLENRFLIENSIRQETFSFPTTGDFVQHLRFENAEIEFKSSGSKRREYPLVLLVHSSTTDGTEEFFRTPIQVASLHVKSSVATDPPTKFLMRISKLPDGRSLVVQDVFTAGASRSGDACAVCLTEHVTHVLLPCKHACLCSSCFPLLEKCPICQQFVTSYFQI